MAVKPEDKCRRMIPVRTPYGPMYGQCGSPIGHEGGCEVLSGSTLYAKKKEGAMTTAEERAAALEYIRRCYESRSAAVAFNEAYGRVEELTGVKGNAEKWFENGKSEALIAKHLGVVLEMIEEVRR